MSKVKKLTVEDINHLRILNIPLEHGDYEFTGILPDSRFVDVKIHKDRFNDLMSVSLFDVENGYPLCEEEVRYWLLSGWFEQELPYWFSC